MPLLNPLNDFGLDLESLFLTSNTLLKLLIGNW